MTFPNACARRCLAILGAMVLVACGAMNDARAAASDSVAHIDVSGHVFRLDAAKVTYAFGVNDKGQLQSLYWGPRLAPGDPLPPPVAPPGLDSLDGAINVVPLEYAGWGEGLYYEPDLKVTFPDGNRDLVLHYVSNSVHDNVLSVVLKDIERPIIVTLQYEIDPGTGIVRRSALIENRTATPVIVEQASAGTWFLPRGRDYTLRYLAGRWAGEDDIYERPVQPGKTVLESRTGSTGTQNEPWFAIRRNDANETHGQVWFGALAWSGSWRITIEQDQTEQVRVTGGFNPFDFGYKLEPGASLQTPSFYAGVTNGGMGEASRLMHRLELTHILPQAPHPRARPVLYNSWEATGFDVNEAGQMALAQKAASIGVERFVVDDGWFGARNSDKAGLGDWTVNPQKFPHGLKPLIDRVHALGMDFGIWVEPEMVNPDSNLYRAHPDWVLNMTGRPRTLGRHQMVLNLARPDVRAYVFHALDTLLSDNQIAFLKWDYNRSWSEPGWPQVPPDQQKDVYVDFVRNVYGILEELRHKHPNVEIESCSGGGARVDLGIMHLTDEVWPSDNTDAFDRLRIQDGFTQAYTPGVMMAWVTDSPSFVNGRSMSLEYRFLSAMQGSLGIGANLTKWTTQDMATARRLIADYKVIRETVQHGDLYRLISPQNGSEHSATENVSPDQAHAVLFAFLHSSTEGYPYPTVRLQGLDPDARYRVRVLQGTLAARTPAVASGAYWMNAGIDLVMHGDFQGAAITFDRE
ncbi:MAG TPA: alpha-galactosidase [Dyella sp.]|uniref:alpha-galactosidase n=1 Tax=Dyella sp. TaxID=1869338 RepID=UPI002CB22867|nr:alpha-galactosidase [Dyella sp.]HUB90098.1 alpha-galactosidase [Dyella sp.]